VQARHAHARALVGACGKFAALAASLDAPPAAKKKKKKAGGGEKAAPAAAAAAAAADGDGGAAGAPPAPKKKKSKKGAPDNGGVAAATAATPARAGRGEGGGGGARAEIVPISCPEIGQKTPPPSSPLWRGCTLTICVSDRGERWLASPPRSEDATER